jgi:hypothetical protein
MAYIKMPGEIPVVNGFHELFEFVLGFPEEAVKIGKLPGDDGNKNDQVYLLCLDYRYSSQA